LLGGANSSYFDSAVSCLLNCGSSPARAAPKDTGPDNFQALGNKATVNEERVINN
jgi:hypothetical protein